LPDTTGEQATLGPAILFGLEKPSLFLYFRLLIDSLYIHKPKRGELGMRIFLSLLFLLAAFPLLAEDEVLLSNQHNGQPLALETFERDQLLTFPTNWKVHGDAKEAERIYKVAEENDNRFLHARAVNQGVQVGLTWSFESSHYPFLSWRWRVEQLPTGADESVKRGNDSAAGVYVLFDSRVLPRVIKYVWSSSLPVSTRLKSPHYRRARIIVLQSGPATDGAWYQETVNIYQDYKELFGGEPGKVEGIAVLTDSDNTQTQAEADYDDFILLSSIPVNGEAPLSVDPARGL
jgi:hypothetical protein